MTAAATLVGVGMPAEQASRVGFTVSNKTGVGTAQTGATALTGNLTILTTAGGSTAFVLPTAISASGPIIVFNNTATTALIFPPSGGTINNGSTDASFSVAQNKVALFFKLTSTAWCAAISA